MNADHKIIAKIAMNKLNNNLEIIIEKQTGMCLREGCRGTIQECNQ